MTNNNEILELAKLVRERNEIATKITKIIGRPAQIGHIGEWIAAKVFDIQLEHSATNKVFDGRFRSGSLVGKTVNIKFYAKHERLLDIRSDALPDYYLVLAGPRAAPGTSRGEGRLWSIDYAFLFHTPPLMQHLAGRGIKIGIATSVVAATWDLAEIYPKHVSQELRLNESQRAQLALFSAAKSSNDSTAENRM